MESSRGRTCYEGILEYWISKYKLFKLEDFFIMKMQGTMNLKKKNIKKNSDIGKNGSMIKNSNTKKNDSIIKNSDMGMQDKMLTFLYKTKIGAVLLNYLTKPKVSEIAGKFLSTTVSCLIIDSFIKANKIDMRQFKKKKYLSYNDFFTREIRPECRPVMMDSDALISPGDGRITAYKITEESEFTIKNTVYSLKSLLQNEKLAQKFLNGYCVILRLSVDDYHRYCFIDNGKILLNVKIDGILHTVNPIANDNYHIYKENTREYTVIQSDNFKTIIQMEVGALLVGKIVNTKSSGCVLKGAEKGYFEFGGSTIVLFFEENTIKINDSILKNSAAGIETKIKYGEQMGEKCLIE